MPPAAVMAQDRDHLREPNLCIVKTGQPLPFLMFILQTLENVHLIPTLIVTKASVKCVEMNKLYSMTSMCQIIHYAKINVDAFDYFKLVKNYFFLFINNSVISNFRK